MVVINWEQLSAVKLDDIQDEEADKLYSDLSEISAAEENDVEKLKLLFRVCQAVMQSKALQADVALEELERIAEKEGMASAKREQGLLNEIEDLKHQIRQLKKFGGDGSVSPVKGKKHEFQDIHEELQKVERENERLQLELHDAEKSLAKEKNENEKLLARLEESERENRDLRREIANLKDEIQEYRHQMEVHRESTSLHQEKDTVGIEKLREKNRQLNKLLGEIEILEKTNDELKNSANEMKSKLEEATKQMDITTTNYIKVKNALRQTDGIIDNLRMDNQTLKAQINELAQQLKAKELAETEVMAAINKRIEEFKTALINKDAEIMDLHSQIARLEEKIAINSSGTDRASVAVLSKALEDRDKQIEVLKEQVKKGTLDLTQTTTLLQQFKQETLRGPQSPQPWSKQRIHDLETALHECEMQLKQKMAEVANAEEHAKSKDQELIKLLGRMQEYEQGEYGLAEAVAEIKDVRNQIKIRDRQIEELTQAVNRNEMFIDELMDENEELRARLHLDPRQPLNANEVKQKQSVRHQKERALNMALQEEISRLEEERIKLKQDIRQLAQMSGQRAAELGVTSEDLKVLHVVRSSLKDRHHSKFEDSQGSESSLMESLIHRLGSETESAADLVKKEAERDVLRVQIKSQEHELEDSRKHTKKLLKEISQLKIEIKEVNEENEHLQQGMQEILQALKDQDDKTDVLLRCPSLERLVNLIETKHIKGSYDTVAYVKSELDIERGRHDQVRSELKKMRSEAYQAKLQLDNAKEKIKKLETELKFLKEHGPGSVNMQILPLPENMPVSSAEMIAVLNTHLIHVLNELSHKNETARKLEDGLQTYHRKFSVARHQMGLLYKDHIQFREEWQKEKEKLLEENKALQLKSEVDAVKIKEHERLADLISKDESEIRRRTAEVIGQIILVRESEAVFRRKYEMLLEIESSLKKENTKIRNEVIAIEKASTEHFGYLQRYKETMDFKISSIQKALDESVPASELEAANRQFSELTAKYRDLLQKDTALVSQTELVSKYEVEAKQYQVEIDFLKKELQSEKEKRHTLEASEEIRMKSEDKKQGTDLTSNGKLALSKRIATLEMKELHERQRADHAVRLYEHQQIAVEELTARIGNLEEKFSELTKINLEQQKVENELRDELSGCVTKTVHASVCTQLEELERQNASLQVEISKQKEMVDVARNQAVALEMLCSSQEKELTSLRQQALNIQSESDEKLIIGKLHRHIVNLQISESTALKKLEKCQGKIKSLEVQCLRLEQRHDDKIQKIYQIRNEYRRKVNHLQKMVQTLRRQFSGALPLNKLEKQSLNLIQLQEDKISLQNELKATKKLYQETEDKLAEAELKCKSAEELTASLKDGTASGKIAEWHSKITELRLKDLKQARQLNQLEQQINHKDQLLQQMEKLTVQLEEEKVLLEKEVEKRQLDWDQREIELESQLQNIEEEKKELSDKVEATVGQLPDMSLPLANQLEQAVETIRRNMKTINETQVELKQLKEQLLGFKRKIKEQEVVILARDKVIAELRLSVPSTMDRANYTNENLNKMSLKEIEVRQAYQIAQATVESLQARIAQKEETISSYQNLLRQAQDELVAKQQRHNEAMQALQHKLNQKTDATLEKFKQVVQQAVERTTTPPAVTQQLIRLRELEDTVVEQETAMRSLNDKLHSTLKERETWRLKVEQALKEAAEEKESLINEHKQTVAQLEKVLLEREEELKNQQQELEGLHAELEEQKNVSAKATTTSTKNTTDRLKQQLQTKEKQLQSLSKVLTELKTDMVKVAQENIRTHLAEATEQSKIQKIVEQKTKDLQDHNVELENNVLRLKKELKNVRDSLQDSVKTIEELKDQLNIKIGEKESQEKENVQLHNEIQGLENKIRRITQSSSAQEEIDKLHKKIKNLEECLQKSQQPEKPFDNEKETSRVSSVKTEVKRWEENKKLKQNLDQMKLRIMSLEKEIEEYERKQKQSKNAIERLEKEKINMEKQIKMLQKGVANNPVLQDLAKQNIMLEEEIAVLKEHLATSHETVIEELKLRNKCLVDKLADQERQLVRLSFARKGNAEEVPEQKTDHKSITGKQNLETIRAESHHEHIAELVVSSPMSNVSNESIKKVGLSGRSTLELETTIKNLKKIIDKLQAESEVNKKVNEDKMYELQKTIITLQEDKTRNEERLKAYKQWSSKSLSPRSQNRLHALEKAASKLASENDQLIQKFRKECDVTEALQQKIFHLETENSRLEVEVAEANSRAQAAEAKLPRFESMDRSEYRKFVVNQKSGEIIQELEKELKASNHNIFRLQKQIKEAADREQKLLIEKAHLQQTILKYESEQKITSVTTSGGDCS